MNFTHLFKIKHNSALVKLGNRLIPGSVMAFQFVKIWLIIRNTRIYYLN